jgi:hypothetical protein
MKNLTSHSHPRSTLERTSERTGLIVSKHIIWFLRPVLGSPMPRVEKGARAHFEYLSYLSKIYI